MVKCFIFCSGCGCNFEKKYGEIGKGFIHVHHVKQVSDMGKDNKIDPIKDVRPVYPNCHAMIHKQRVPYTVNELKDLMKKSQQVTVSFTSDGSNVMHHLSL